MRAIISIDVQPIYEAYIGFSISEMIQYMESSDIQCFYVYNDSAVMGCDMDERYEYISWLSEKSDYQYESFNLIPKSYGFIRSAMAYGICSDQITELLKYMLDNDYYDSNMIDIEEIDNSKLELFEDLKNWLGEDADESIYLPCWVTEFNKFTEIEIFGGSENECLSEMLILLDALEISYTIKRKFIY